MAILCPEKISGGAAQGGIFPAGFDNPAAPDQDYRHVN
jgi:hypothetical protein